MKPVKSSPLVKPAGTPPSPLTKTPDSQEAEITKLESDFKTFVEGLQKQYQEIQLRRVKILGMLGLTRFGWLSGERFKTFEVMP